MSQQHPFTPPPSVPIPVQLPKDSSVWDRISNWVSENKAVVYTIAGVTVVVVAGAGVFYYTKDGSVRCQPLAALDPTERGFGGNHRANKTLLNSQKQMRSPNSARRRGESGRKPRRKPRQSEMLPHQRRPDQHPRLPASTKPTRSQNSPKPPSKLCRKMSVKTGLSS